MKAAAVIAMCSTEIYINVWIDKHLSDTFLIENGLKIGYNLSPPPFNFAFEHAIRKV
jgi:hypothetical protein